MAFIYSGECSRCGATESRTFPRRLGPGITIADAYDTECCEWPKGGTERCGGNIFMTLQVPADHDTGEED